ncbi:serine/arginine repetitive matrix protein 1-like [Triticum dicoccoides]|uniref:serine/arginine repetitive matrix protein 1-like n=1 Tax=Triticum dicoccoides TaxID=85692 RepID=UPI00188DDE27|nr:serine/arginine repetitive matrix protein 1-like [Triticum dicoccoides]
MPTTMTLPGYPAAPAITVARARRRPRSSSPPSPRRPCPDAITLPRRCRSRTRRHRRLPQPPSSRRPCPDAVALPQKKKHILAIKYPHRRRLPLSYRARPDPVPPVSLLPAHSGRLNRARRSRRRGFPHQSGATLPSHPERQPRGIGGATRCRPRRWCRSATCRTRRCGTTWSRTPSSGSSSVAWAAPSASASPCSSSPATLFFILRDAFQQCFTKFFTLVKGFCNLYAKEKGLEKMTDLKNRFSHLLNQIAKKNR